MTRTDLDLLRAFAGSGDAAAFAELVARHERWIFDAARRRLKDDHLADDARQGVFLLLAEKAATLAQPDAAPVSAWLFHVVHYTCSGILRTRSRQARHEVTAADLLRDDRRRATDDASLTVLEDTIAQLPPRDREAIVRRFYQHESFARLGEALGISAEAARKRVDRILARCRASMSLDGIEAAPEAMLDARTPASGVVPYRPPSAETLPHIAAIAKGTLVMVQQMEAIRFAVMTAEFYVRSVEENLDFFEKLGFRRHFVEVLDENGLAPRASLRGGHARIWLRRATPEHPPQPGVLIYVWLDGGEQAVIRHREAIAAQGVAVNQYFYDGALMNFTVTTPDGYSIGFFSTYQPHTYDAQADG